LIIGMDDTGATSLEPIRTLIARYRQTGRVKPAAYQRTKFATPYTAGDIALMAYVDKAHGQDLVGADLSVSQLSGLAQEQRRGPP